MRTHASDRVSFTICRRERRTGQEYSRIISLDLPVIFLSSAKLIEHKTVMRKRRKDSYLFENKIEHQRIVEAVFGIEHLQKETISFI